MLFKRYAGTLLCALWCTSIAVEAEVVVIKDNGFTIKNHITVDRSVKDSWNGLINSVGQWWPADHTWWGNSANLTISPYAGGCFCETAGDNSAEHMRISYVEQNKLLRMTGGLGPLQGMGMYGALDWQFETTDEQQTQIILTYRVSGLSDKETYEGFVSVVDKVQALQLGALGTFLTVKDN
ncbi:MAG: SRPBCC domain-containing protein [Aestuariibacter sp.]